MGKARGLEASILIWIAYLLRFSIGVVAAPHDSLNQQKSLHRYILPDKDRKSRISVADFCAIHLVAKAGLMMSVMPTELIVYAPKS